MLKLNLLFAAIFLLSSCASQNTNSTFSSKETLNSSTATGVVYFESTLKLEEAYSNLKTALEDNNNIGVVTEVDHSQNATSVDLELPPTQVIFFGNPNLGTPLMQKNQLAGLDLPQKVLFYEDKNQVFVLYNSTEYLASRYGVGEVESLSKTSKALNNLVSTATKTQGKHTKKQNVGLEEGIINVKSTTDFESTYNNLKSAIEANENISVMGELDHKKNAASVGMNLRPTKVIMFGNPKLGTPIMHTKRNVGLDLPQKMLVWENAKGKVYISYNNANFLAKKHNLEKHKHKFKEISKALEMLANVAAEID